MCSLNLHAANDASIERTPNVWLTIFTFGWSRKTFINESSHYRPMAYIWNATLKLQIESPTFFICAYELFTSDWQFWRIAFCAVHCTLLQVPTVIYMHATRAERKFNTFIPQCIRKRILLLHYFHSSMFLSVFRVRESYEISTSGCHYTRNKLNRTKLGVASPSINDLISIPFQLGNSINLFNVISVLSVKIMTSAACIIGKTSTFYKEVSQSSSMLFSAGFLLSTLL